MKIRIFPYSQANQLFLGYFVIQELNFFLNTIHRFYGIVNSIEISRCEFNKLIEFRIIIHNGKFH